MKLAEKLDQQQLQDILITAYKKGSENENITVVDLVEDIKKQLTTMLKTERV